MHQNEKQNKETTQHAPPKGQAIKKEPYRNIIQAKEKYYFQRLWYGNLYIQLMIFQWQAGSSKEQFDKFKSLVSKKKIPERPSYAMSNLDRTYPPHSSSLTRIYYTSPLMHLAGEKKKKLYFPNPYFHKTVDT